MRVNRIKKEREGIEMEKKKQLREKGKRETEVRPCPVSGELG